MTLTNELYFSLVKSATADVLSLLVASAARVPANEINVLFVFASLDLDLIDGYWRDTFPGVTLVRRAPDDDEAYWEGGTERITVRFASLAFVRTCLDTHDREHNPLGNNPAVICDVASARSLLSLGVALPEFPDAMRITRMVVWSTRDSDTAESILGTDLLSLIGHVVGAA
jgi:hypothetical protein